MNKYEEVVNEPLVGDQTWSDFVRESKKNPSEDDWEGAQKFLNAFTDSIEEAGDFECQDPQREAEKHLISFRISLLSRLEDNYSGSFYNACKSYVKDRMEENPDTVNVFLGFDQGSFSGFLQKFETLFEAESRSTDKIDPADPEEVKISAIEAAMQTLEDENSEFTARINENRSKIYALGEERIVVNRGLTEKAETKKEEDITKAGRALDIFLHAMSKG